MFRFETDGRTSGADLPTRPVALVSARRDTVYFGTNRGELAADGRAGGEILLWRDTALLMAGGIVPSMQPPAT